MKLKSAIIDNGLSEISVQIEKLCVLGGCVIEDGSFVSAQPTHGDKCADVFRAVSGKAFDISIRLPSKDNGKLDTLDFITAVNWCAEQDMSLVCMSLSSNEPYDMPMLADVFNRLQDNGTVFVASAANNGTLSAPACLDGVFGVRDDRSGILGAGQIGYIKSPVDGINWVYPSYMPNGYPSSCSYATAALSGVIYNLITSGYDSYSSIENELLRNAISQEFSYRIKQGAADDETLYVALPFNDIDAARDVREQLIPKQYISAIINSGIKNNPGQYVFMLPEGEYYADELTKLAAMAQAQVVLACVTKGFGASWADIDFRSNKAGAAEITRMLLDAYT